MSSCLLQGFCSSTCFFLLALFKLDMLTAADLNMSWNNLSMEGILIWDYLDSQLFVSFILFSKLLFQQKCRLWLWETVMDTFTFFLIDYFTDSKSDVWNGTHSTFISFIISLFSYILYFMCILLNLKMVWIDFLNQQYAKDSFLNSNNYLTTLSQDQITDLFLLTLKKDIWEATTRRKLSESLYLCHKVHIYLLI